MFLRMLLITLCLFLPYGAFAAKSLFIYVGSASKPATEEIVKRFEKKTGVKVNAIYGGSGYVLSQMELTQKGDIYFPGSSDFMEIAKNKKLVYPETEKIVVYLVPAINVQRGNPKNIQSIHDLTKPGIRVVIANPEFVCVGTYAVELIEKILDENQKKAFKNNLVNYTSSCAKTAATVALKSVDAVVGWRVFEHWNPKAIQTIPFKKEEIVRVGYIPIAISVYTKQKALAEQFLNYILSEESQGVFREYNYFPTSQAAIKWIGEDKPIGGEYKLPDAWKAQ